MSDQPVFKVGLQVCDFPTRLPALIRIAEVIHLCPEFIMFERVDPDLIPVPQACDELLFECEVIDRVVDQILD